MSDPVPASESRQVAYDRAVAALRRVDPKAFPVARLEDVASIARVSARARDAKASEPLPAWPENLLIVRVGRMQDACAKLVAKATHLGVKVTWPEKHPDPAGQLLQLNAFHAHLEKQIQHFESTTQQQRSIDNLGVRVVRLEAQNASILAALDGLKELLPHLGAK